MMTGVSGKITQLSIHTDVPIFAYFCFLKIIWWFFISIATKLSTPSLLVLEQ